MAAFVMGTGIWGVVVFYLKVICSTVEAEHAMKGSFQDAEAIEFIYTFE